jgi:hypothetical protein
MTLPDTSAPALASRTREPMNSSRTHEEQRMGSATTHGFVIPEGSGRNRLSTLDLLEA